MVDNEMDYMSKYSRTEEELELADKIMLGQEPASNKELDAVKTILSGDKKIHKRTEDDYENIYNAFKEIEAEEFLKFMGYGVDIIEEIGVKKFIDTIDWRDALDINSYKTDTLHAVPCVHCGKEFTIFEKDFCLCEQCQELYNMDMVEAVIESLADEIGGDSGIIAASCIAEFAGDEDMRKKYLKDPNTVMPVHNVNIYKREGLG